ncbi:hypothetical protein [Sinobaca sp. H24]|uniref:hypothetical protein n=1 Tax=Sinobaca sp. H24 TaxID=2923376 RepID=UPI00207970F9|nr:hypothetical protein [Sinobaca sp. H24]
MKTQTVFIISLVLAIIIAVFAVINVNSVEVIFIRVRQNGAHPHRPRLCINRSFYRRVD